MVSTKGLIITAVVLIGCGVEVDDDPASVANRVNALETKTVSGPIMTGPEKNKTTTARIISDMCFVDCKQPYGDVTQDCIERCLDRGPKSDCLKLCNDRDEYWDRMCENHCRVPEFYWSYSGIIRGKKCVPWINPIDIDEGWDNNWLCSDENWGLQALTYGTFSGCTRIHEDADPNGWDNISFCPTSSRLSFGWSQAGPLAHFDNCLRINEPEDPHAWNDNYLCWKLRN